MVHAGQPVDGACHTFQPTSASLADGIDEMLQIDRLLACRPRSQRLPNATDTEPCGRCGRGPCTGTIIDMITVDSLSKSYGATAVVRTVSFECEPGTITGFLGPNGAGKSTTLRMITGLTRPDGGTATVDGRPFAELPNTLRVAGTLLDASAMHPGRTGRATLRIAALMDD
jgi:ABC-type glutathione transport system ATPase component